MPIDGFNQDLWRKDAMNSVNHPNKSTVLILWRLLWILKALRGHQISILQKHYKLCLEREGEELLFGDAVNRHLHECVSDNLLTARIASRRCC